MERVVRALLLACLASLSAVAGQASYLGPAPTITGLSPWVVSAGDVLTVSGTDLANSLGGCTAFGTAPTVYFTGLEDGADHQGQLVGTDSSNCTNSMLKVVVPSGFSGGARVYVVDPGGQRSKNDNFEITLQPTATLTPASGQVGTIVTINGSNLPPPTLAPAPYNEMNFTYPGINSSLPSSFQPGDTSGSAQITLHVSTDADNPSANLQTVTVPAGSYQFLPPSVNTTPIAGKGVGDQVTISGANLGSGGSVTFTGGLHGQSLNWSSSLVAMTIPAGAQDGPLTVRVSGYGPAVAGPTITISPRVKAMTPASGSAGTAVSISGYNFGGSAGKVTAGGVDEAVSSWADQAIAFTLSGDTDSGAVSITRADGLTAVAPSISIVPRLDKIESNNVKAGAPIVIDGVSLGAAIGTARVGSSAATPQLWSRTSVLLALPTSLAPGTYPVVLTSAAGAASNALSLTVVPGPASPAPTSSAGGHSPSQFIDNNHQFHKPPKTESPVQLSLTAASHQLKAGGSCDLTVLLSLNGKPVSGAEVKLRMLFTPGDDFTFTPETGTTDATGTFRATVTISKTSGDSIIQAESGIFSDQDHIVGTGGTAPVLSTVNPAANTGGIVPLMGLGALALLLVGLGLWLNLRSGRTASA